MQSSVKKQFIVKISHHFQVYFRHSNHQSARLYAYFKATYNLRGKEKRKVIIMKVKDIETGWIKLAWKHFLWYFNIF